MRSIREQFTDSSDVCGLFNISNFEGLDDTEPESRIAPIATILCFEIKTIRFASKKRSKGIIEHAAEETKCAAKTNRRRARKNKSMLLTVSGTTEKWSSEDAGQDALAKVSRNRREERSLAARRARGSITNTIKRERKKERDHKPHYIVTEREKKKERKRETDVENIVYVLRNRHGQSNTDKGNYRYITQRKKERKKESGDI